MAHDVRVQPVVSMATSPQWLRPSLAPRFEARSEFMAADFVPEYGTARDLQERGYDYERGPFLDAMREAFDEVRRFELPACDWWWAEPCDGDWDASLALRYEKWFPDDPWCEMWLDSTGSGGGAELK